MLSLSEMNELDEIAREIVKLKAKKNDTSLFELVSELNVGIYRVKKAIAYYDTVVNYKNFDISEIEKQINIQDLCKQMLRYQIQTGKTITIQLLISELNFKVMDAKKVLEYYRHPFELDWPLSEKELKEMNSISQVVINYFLSQNKKLSGLSVAELSIRLNITIRQAKLVIPFINKVIQSSISFKFAKYPPERLNILDNLSSNMIRNLGLNRASREMDYIKLAGMLDIGIYTVKEVLEYYKWIINQYKVDFKQMPKIQISKLDKGTTKTIKYIVNNNKKFNLSTLIYDLNFNLRRAEEIIQYYKYISKMDINFETINDEDLREIEINARKIYDSMESGKISSYDLNEIVSKLDIGVADAWKNILFIKRRIIPELEIDTTISLPEEEVIEVASTTLNLAESITATDEILNIKSDSIEIKEQEVKIKDLIEKIEVKREFDYVGGLIRFKVVVRNNSNLVINNIEIWLRMPEHVRLIQVLPKVCSRKDHGFINNMQHGQSQSIDFYIEPLICGKTPIEVMVVYQDVFGKSRSIIREPKIVETKCPPIINLGEENIARVRNLLESELPAKQFKNFKLKYDPWETFSTLIEAINSWTGKSVSKPIIKEDPFYGEIYYFISNKIEDPILHKREQIVIRLEVNENQKLILLLIGCEKNETACGVITHIWEICKKKLAEKFGISLKTFVCPQCGAPIHQKIEFNKEFKCIYCNWLINPELL
ncbi:MAG: hypothetical protein ACTSPY_10230 [Candidatus Helarchaeota archaeon]